MALCVRGQRGTGTGYRPRQVRKSDEIKEVKPGLTSFLAELSPPAAEYACSPGAISSDVEYWKPQRCSSSSPALRQFPGRRSGRSRGQYTKLIQESELSK